MDARFPTNTTNALVQAMQAADETTRVWLETDSAVKALIQTFNLGVEGSFAAGGVQALAAVCTAAGYANMQKKFLGWRGNHIQSLQLVSCDFLAFHLTIPDEAEVFTFEKWVYTYEDGRQVFTQGSVDHYLLARKADGWKVKFVENFTCER